MGRVAELGSLGHRKSRSTMNRNIASLIVVTVLVLRSMAEDTPKRTFVRTPGRVDLGVKGGSLVIRTSKNERLSWDLNWICAAPTRITKRDYFKGASWFAFVESESRVWFYDGLDDLMVAECSPKGIAQHCAIYKGLPTPIIEGCPPEVFKALPQEVKKMVEQRRP